MCIRVWFRGLLDLHLGGDEMDPVLGIDSTAYQQSQFHNFKVILKFKNLKLN